MYAEAVTWLDAGLVLGRNGQRRIYGHILQIDELLRLARVQHQYGHDEQKADGCLAQLGIVIHDGMIVFFIYCFYS